MALRTSGVNVAGIARHNCPHSHLPLSHEDERTEMNQASNFNGDSPTIKRIADIVAVNQPGRQHVLFSAFLRIPRVYLHVCQAHKMAGVLFLRRHTSKRILTALIGIMGTVLGTVLGGPLARFLVGKGFRYISAYQEGFEFNKASVKSPASSFYDTEAYFYQLSLNVYNSSCDTKIIRNHRIEFLNGKEVAIYSIPNILDSRCDLRPFPEHIVMVIPESREKVTSR